MSVLLDTHEHVKRLKAVGFTDEQAEAQTSLLIDLVDTQLVTREFLDSRLKDIKIEIASVKTSLQAEIASVKTSLQSEIASVKTSLQSEIASVKADIVLLKWMIGIVMGGIMALILKAFFPVG